MSALVKFAFRGDELDVIPAEGTVYVSVRRVCEHLGLGYGSQTQKLHADPSLTVTKLVTQMPGDDQRREILCIDVRSLPLWLATIHPSKVKPAIREKLIAYKREAAEVVADHFLGARRQATEAAMVPVVDPPTQEALPETSEAIALAALSRLSSGHSDDIAELRETTRDHEERIEVVTTFANKIATHINEVISKRFERCEARIAALEASSEQTVQDLTALAESGSRIAAQWKKRQPKS